MLTLCARNNVKNNKQTAVPPKIDMLLDSIGLMRHIVPQDNNSLFRCISQCMFLTQSFHPVVRQHLLQYSKLKSEEFSNLSQTSVREYAKIITDKQLDGDLLDMHIASKVYNISIAFFLDAHPFIPIIIETPNPIKKLSICLNFEGSYDLVLIKESVANLSFNQAVVYEMIYNKVFKLSGVHFAMKEMLYDRKLIPCVKTNDPVSLEKRAVCTDMKELLQSGITPFPFKVAKALSPKLYRNTEYDIWSNTKRQKFHGKWNNREFKEGTNCLVTIDNKDHHCYIQHINGKHDLVEVYVKDLTRKIFVEFDKLKLISVEEDTSGSLQVNQVSSTTDNRNGFIFQDTEQHGNPIQFNNPGFIHGALPGQVFPPLCYVQQYQQQHVFPMDSPDIPNDNNMPPWYVFTPPPQVLPIPPPNWIPGLDTPKVIGPHGQPIPWYCLNQSTMYMQCSNNGEESGVAMDSNHAYQPWPVSEFDVPTNEFQQ